MKNHILPFLLILFLFSCADQSEVTEGDETITLSITKESKASDSKTGDNYSPEAFEKAYKVVDKMPLFGGCYDKACSDEKLISYIQSNVEYPSQAKAASVEGRVYIQFIIELDGSVSNVFIVRDVGAGTGEAAKAVVEGMNDLQQGWVAGEENGEKVPVMFTLPVSFKLQ